MPSDDLTSVLAQPLQPPDGGTTDDALAQRMADLAGFSRTLVHDLRNPLSVVRQNVFLLQQRLGADDPRVARALERMDDQVSLMVRILESVQAFYKADTPKLQRVNFNDVVHKVTATTTVPEAVSLQVTLMEERLAIAGDLELLDAAVRALLRNALDALPAGGTISVDTCSHDGRARLVVRDSGPGIPADVAPRVFEPLFTTREGHAGLGLAMADKVARAHGGRLYHEPSEAHGATMVLEVPLS